MSEEQLRALKMEETDPPAEECRWLQDLGMAFSLHPVEKWGSLAHHLKKLNSANTLD